MPKAADIHKAAGILVNEKRLLVVRSRDKSAFFAPGGKVQAGECPRDALIRELREELTVTVIPADLTEFGTFYASATDDESKTLRMDVFFVHAWKGAITPSNEIEEVRWLSSAVPSNLVVGSIFRHEVLPRLKERGLVE
jgi:8-oxo-dGTP pyrophosphatase MutT (NUDIX family)